MGTRGTVGFFVNGKTIAVYNHFDSYPAWLGLRVLEDLQYLFSTYSIEGVCQRVQGIRVVQEDEALTEQDLAQYGAFLDDLGHPSVGWYELLREMQGSFKSMIEQQIALDNTLTWMCDGLWNEFGYILNVDDQVLEFYKGFTSADSCVGRYCDCEDDLRPDRVTLLGKAGLELIRDLHPDHFKDFLRAFYGEEEI